MGAGKIVVTRIDFALAGDVVVVNKIDDMTVAGRSIVVDSNEKPASELDKMLAWCETNGFVVRRYAPLGARAWRGERPRPVRTKAAVIKKHADLLAYPVKGLQVHALDLAYDC